MRLLVIWLLQGRFGDVDGYAFLVSLLDEMRQAGRDVVNVFSTSFGTPLFLAWEGWLVDLLGRAAVVANPAADAYSLGLMLACLAFNCELTASFAEHPSRCQLPVRATPTLLCGGN